MISFLMRGNLSSPTSRGPLAFVWLALFVSCGTKVAPSGYEGPLPDVVIVLVDTLRADFVDLDGDSASPFLARLADEAVVFEDASSAAPWTLPSIASLVTGRHLAEHGVVQEARRLPSGMKTLAQRLGELGYSTRAFYRNAFAGPMCDLDRGYMRSVQTDDEIGGEEVAPLLMRADGAPDEAPLFLYVHNAEPHDPHNSPDNKSLFRSSKEREFLAWYRKTVKRYRILTRRAYQEEHRDDGIDFTTLQAKILHEFGEHQQETYRIYARAVKESDERIEEIVAKLRERGRWDQTIFIVVSDHGEEMGEHGGWLHDQSLYQELVHVPLLIRFPSGKFGGTRVHEPASLIDLIPTVFGGLASPEWARDLPGLDWWQVLSGTATAADTPRVVSMRVNERKRYGPWERSRGDRNVAVRDGKWKAIWNAELDHVELYDIEQDPQELNNLAPEQPIRAASLRDVARETWVRLESRSQVEQGPGFEGLDEDTLRNLEGLGYVGGEDDE